MEMLRRWAKDGFVRKRNTFGSISEYPTNRPASEEAAYRGEFLSLLLHTAAL